MKTSITSVMTDAPWSFDQDPESSQPSRDSVAILDDLLARLGARKLSGNGFVPIRETHQVTVLVQRRCHVTTNSQQADG